MADESFHLTPLDVRRYDFGSALRGYDKTRVEQFREQVADELERMTRVTQDLESKAKSFHEQLRAFRERDKALNDALVSAQQLRAEIRQQAEREGDLVVREARAEGERILSESRSQVQHLQQQLEALEHMRRTHLAQLRSLVQRQLAEIEATESHAAGRDSNAAPSAGAPSASPPSPPTSAASASAASASAASASAALASPPPVSAAPASSADRAEPTRPEGASKLNTPAWLDASITE
jgi:cell division initiation protein